MRQKCIIITGGLGFIGTEVRKMLKTDLPIVVVDKLLKHVHPDLSKLDLGDNIDVYVGDITNHTMWDNVFELYEPEIIIHLAAETSTGLSETKISTHVDSNASGLASLFTAMEMNSIRPSQFVLASSRAVYGEGIWRTEDGENHVALKRRFDDLALNNWNPRSKIDSSEFLVSPLSHNWKTTPKNPTSVYGLTKSFQEDLLEIWAEPRQVKTRILRFQNVYGFGQTPSNSYTGILTHFIRTGMKGGTIEVYEGGDIIRDFVYVTDVARAIVSSIESTDSVIKADVGGGKPMSLMDVAKSVSIHYQAPSPISNNKFRVGDIRYACSEKESWPDGWYPEIEFAKGLELTIEYIEAFFSN
jgi:dTDP-L-rhamnose 4-epimerase